MHRNKNCMRQTVITYNFYTAINDEICEIISFLFFCFTFVQFHHLLEVIAYVGAVTDSIKKKICTENIDRKSLPEYLWKSYLVYRTMKLIVLSSIFMQNKSDFSISQWLFCEKKMLLMNIMRMVCVHDNAILSA